MIVVPQPPAYVFVVGAPKMYDNINTFTLIGRVK